MRPFGRGFDIATDALMNVPGGRLGTFLLIMSVLFLLGMFIDWIDIVPVMVPAMTPMVHALSLGPLWFAIVGIVNVQLSFIRPPLACSVFFLQGTLQPELGVTTGHIVRGVLPYVGLTAIGLLMMIRLPQFILWLPGRMASCAEGSTLMGHGCETRLSVHPRCGTTECPGAVREVTWSVATAPARQPRSRRLASVIPDNSTG